MWYHIMVTYGETRKRYWWNYGRDSLIENLLIPLIHRQVILAPVGGRRVLFNLGAVIYFRILESERKLTKPTGKNIPNELEDSNFEIEHDVTEKFVNEIKLLSSSKSSKSLIEQSLSESLKQIFVVMRFGNAALDSAYEGVIKPVGESFGYKVLRVDEIENSGNINQQILENISRSELIIADLSGERPNCYYEAGFAHALGKELIFCIKTGDSIHFDLAQYRFIEWQTEAELRKKLHKRLESYTSEQSQDPA